MTIKTEKYEKAAARLAKLPRAERFEELLDFPVQHTFKVIGRKGTFYQEVSRALARLSFEDVTFVERPSKTGRFISLTFQLTVDSGAHLDEIYRVLQSIPGLAYLL